MKKILFILIPLVLLISYYVINSHIEKNNNSFLLKIEELLPKEVKNILKKTIFVFKNQKILEQQLNLKNDQLLNQSTQLLNILNTITDFNFKITENQNIKNTNYRIAQYTNSLLPEMGPRAYIQVHDDNLILITGTGSFMYMKINNFKDEDINFKKINSNFLDIVGLNYVSQNTTVVKHMLIENNKLYVSYIKNINNDCYMNAILVAKINYENIFFEDFFDTNDCQPFFDDESGGNLSIYKNNNILLTTGSWKSSVKQKNNNPQNLNSLVGKIISINKDTKKYKILSMGHRNPQGLFYDKENDIIFSAEHGPQGGDEININISPEKVKPKNYGWPISSYGEHYGYPASYTDELYKYAPLYKSHHDYGFVEPLKYFVPSIATSQIIKTNELSNNIVIYVGSMGYEDSNREGILSVHKFILNKSLSIIEHTIIEVGDRVRDIFFIEKENKLFLFLENSGSIAVLQQIN